MGLSPKSRFSLKDVSANVKLDSWKEIAAYLDRDPRTVQMWEKLEGFPVHRLNHQARASVYAYTAEIDAWLRARSGQRPIAARPEPEGESAHAFSSRIPRILVVLIATLVLVGLLAAWLRVARKPRPEPSAPVSILAVLPFQIQTSTDDTLADSLTEGVIEDLGRVGKIQVISRRSAMVFKGSHAPIPQIAARLHATVVLQGTVAQVGDELQVTVELLGAPEFTHLWGATYRRKGSAQLSPDAIASAIASDVTRKLTGSTPKIDFPAQGVDPRARQSYLTARFYWNQRNLAGLQKAIALYRQALVIDPKYAAAYAGLAESYDLMTDRGVMAEQEAFNRAKAAAQTALSMDPASAEGYNALAFATYRQDWNFSRAEELFNKAIQTDPDSAVAHQWYGEFLGDLRRFDESIAELRKAKQLDPLSPMVGADLADGYLHAGRIAEADAELTRLLDLYPEFLPAHMYRITVAERQGKLGVAETEAQIYFEQTGDWKPLEGARIRRLNAAGKTDEARAAVERVMAATDRAPLIAYARAELLFTIGQAAAGYAALEEAYREHSWWMVNLMVDPAFEGVRSQARFLDLARRVGLPVNPKTSLLARNARAAQ